jgi:hypothetical protein
MFLFKGEGRYIYKLEHIKKLEEDPRIFCDELYRQKKPSLQFCLQVAA